MMSTSRSSQVLTCTAVVALLVGLIGMRPTAQTRGRTAAAGAPADPCAAPANKIIAENCKPGNPSTEWDINGPGDPTIVGFPTDISYNIGETARFKVRTDSAKYRVDIYRTGWYGGLGARLVSSVKPSAPLPQRQPECAVDWKIRLYDCGTWGVSAEWAIPADALSGLFDLAGADDFSYSGWNPLAFLAAGQASGNLNVNWLAGALGLFSDTIIFNGLGTNASDPLGLAQTRQLTIRANVINGVPPGTVPEPGTLALLLGAAAAGLLARRRGFAQGAQGAAR